MKDDEYEKLAAAICQRKVQTIDALHEMDASDLQKIEKAILEKYSVDIASNGAPEGIHIAIAKSRAGAK